ncbi:Transcription factor TFIIIB component B'' [Seiridium cupressi]
MSSMLKKTGGLAFKPKVARRPGAASASQAPTSQSTTRAPTAEPSQTPSTSVAPTAPVAPTPAVPGRLPASQTSKETSRPNQEEERANPRGESATDETQPQPPAEPAPTPAEQTISIPPTTTAPSQPEALSQNVSTSTGPSSSGARPQESAPAPISHTVHASTPLASPSPPLPSASLSSELTPFDTASRHPLQQSTSRPQDLATAASTEASSSSSTTVPAASLPSPAVTAISRSSAPGRALSSPSPFPGSENVPTPALLGESQAHGSTAPGPSEPPKKKRQYRRRKQPAENEAGPGEGETAIPKPKRPRKRKAPAAPQELEGEAAASGETAPSAPKRFRRRNITPDPEDIPEDGRPDHTTTKIGDLTKDLGIGKKFKHADLILERQRQARHEAKLRKLEKQKRAMGTLPSEGNQEEGPRAGGGDADSSVRLNQGQGIALDIIDGQIMVNQSSLVINQHAAESNIQLQTVEEDEFTHLTTSASYMRPSRAMGTNHWDDEDTERFYKYLKMFGTDFETISHMFSGKNRRQVKLKFNREERLRPNRVNAAIMACGEKRVTIDLDDYKANRSGFDDNWITQDKFHAEQEQLRKEQEKELEAKRQERRDLGLLDDDPSLSKTGVEGNAEDGEEEIIIDEADVGGATVAVTA